MCAVERASVFLAYSRRRLWIIIIIIILRPTPSPRRKLRFATYIWRLSRTPFHHLVLAPSNPSSSRLHPYSDHLLPACRRNRLVPCAEFPGNAPHLHTSDRTPGPSPTNNFFRPNASDVFKRNGANCGSEEEQILKRRVSTFVFGFRTICQKLPERTIEYSTLKL